MTNLEFIEKEIKHWKEIIKHQPSSNNIQKHLNDKLQILQRIQTILEIWEIVKVELGIKVIERNCGIWDSRYALRCNCEDDIPILDEEAEAFKKALEVER